MTIGIAAAGEGAGRAVLACLALVEGLAAGAVGGFVSFAVLDAGGGTGRAEAQRGGAAGLLAAGHVAEHLLAAPRVLVIGQPRESGPA